MELNKQVTLSLSEVATRYGCSKGYVKGLLENGKLEGRKVGDRWFIPAEAADCLFLGKCQPKEAA